MNIIFLGSFYPSDILKRIQNDACVGFANDLLQKSYLQGLFATEKVDNVMGLTIPNIISFPHKSSIFYHKGKQSAIEGVLCDSISFLNIIYLKHRFKLWSLLRYEKKHRSVFQKADFIFIYDLDSSFLRFAHYLKKKYANLRVVNIVPDLVGFVGMRRNLINDWHQKRLDNKIRKLFCEVDYFILLAKGMAEYLNIGQPYMVLEGIYNTSAEAVFANKDSNSIQMVKTILYSGNMSKRNGVDVLLEAFKLIKDQDYRLVLCGDGELRDEIEKMSTNDNRICFMGNVSHDEVLMQQSKATLLINPRPGIEDFTKYSFPSKTMEYFASGKVVLMYRLSGVPSEYYKYCFTLKGISATSMAKDIINICELPFTDRKIIGEQARHFVLSNKTPLASVEAVLSFLASVN